MTNPQALGSIQRDLHSLLIQGSRFAEQKGDELEVLHWMKEVTKRCCPKPHKRIIYTFVAKVIGNNHRIRWIHVRREEGIGEIKNISSIAK